MAKIVQVPCPVCGHVHHKDARILVSTAPFKCEGTGCGRYININQAQRENPGKNVKFSGMFSDGESINVDITVRSDGIWHFANEIEKSLTEALEFDSDRAVAVIAGSMIETRLKNLLVQLGEHVPEYERLFHSTGPLGSFSVKIDLAYMMGVITRDAYDDLMTIKDIRNDFAHRLDIKDFLSQKIKDKCKNLKMIETHVGQFEGTFGSYDNLAKPRIFVQSYERLKTPPRTRYLITAQLFNFCFGSSRMPQSPIPVI